MISTSGHLISKFPEVRFHRTRIFNWVIKSTDVYLSLIYYRLHELIYDSKLIHADESPVKVMRIDHAKIKNGKKIYMWVYHKLTKERRDLKVAGCWVHARRPFAKFIKSVGQDTARGSIAQKAYSIITEIMHIDNTFDDLSVTDRKKQRQLVLSEKVDTYFARMGKTEILTGNS